jgi:uncharacterized phage protein (TIGR02216 family)
MALGLGGLQLSPAAFWAMTPRELEAAAAFRFGQAGAATVPLAREDLQSLLQRFPDI